MTKKRILSFIGLVVIFAVGWLVIIRPSQKTPPNQPAIQNPISPIGGSNTGSIQLVDIGSRIFFPISLATNKLRYFSTEGKFVETSLDSLDETELTQGAIDRPSDISWSPNGLTAILKYKQNGKTNLRLINFNTKKAINIDGYSAALIDDSRYLVAKGDEQSTELSLIGPTDTPKTLIKVAGLISEMSVDPTGQQIAYLWNNQNQQKTLSIYNLGTGTNQEISPIADKIIAWSLNGTLAFSQNENGQSLLTYFSPTGLVKTPYQVKGIGLFVGKNLIMTKSNPGVDANDDLVSVDSTGQATAINYQNSDTVYKFDRLLTNNDQQIFGLVDGLLYQINLTS